MSDGTYRTRMNSTLGPPPTGTRLSYGQGATETQQAKVLARTQNAQPISLPKHLYPPEDAETVDISNVATLPVGAGGQNVLMLRFQPRRGELGIITHYSMSNDALLATDADFFPTVNGKRILPLHGDPLDKFRLYLSLAPDLSVLKQGIVIVGPEDIYEWRISNYAAVPITCGVRGVGYVTRHQLVEARRFG